MGKFWAATQAFVIRFWGGILVAFALVFGVLKLLSGLVSGVNFIDDLKDALKVAKPVTNFFVRQPEWAFYPTCIAMIVVGLLVAAARWRPLIAAIAARSVPQPDKSAVQKQRRNAESTVASHWAPDITFAEALSHIRYGSVWRPSYRSYNGDAEALEELRNALFASKVASWAREHPKTEEFQIHHQIWAHGVEIRPQDNWAFSRLFNTTLHKIRLCEEEVKAAWPPK